MTRARMHARAGSSRALAVPAARWSAARAAATALAVALCLAAPRAQSPTTPDREATAPRQSPPPFLRGADRHTVTATVVRPAAPGHGAIVAADTAHLAVQATASVGVVAPGRRVTLTFEVAPAPGMHVYAPGAHGYQAIRFRFSSDPWLAPEAMVYAPPEIYHFVPLDERVETYQRPFTLRQDVTIVETADSRRALGSRRTLTIGGRLEYQACDDRVCYAPAAVAMAFPLALAPAAPPK